MLSMQLSFRKLLGERYASSGSFRPWAIRFFSFVSKTTKLPKLLIK